MVELTERFPSTLKIDSLYSLYMQVLIVILLYSKLLSTHCCVDAFFSVFRRCVDSIQFCHFDVTGLEKMDNEDHDQTADQTKRLKHYVRFPENCICIKTWWVVS